MTKDNIISCDFDGSLDDHFDGAINHDKKEVRDFILRLIRRGYEVYIITRRYGPDNSSMGLIDEHLKVWKVAQELGIPKDRIIFTDRQWKYSFIDSIGACIHIDDDEREQFLIKGNLPDVKMIWLGHDNWPDKLIDTIEEHDKVGIWIGNEKNIIKIGIILIIILLTFILL